MRWWLSELSQKQNRKRRAAENQADTWLLRHSTWTRMKVSGPRTTELRTPGPSWGGTESSSSEGGLGHGAATMEQVTIVTW